MSTKFLFRLFLEIDSLIQLNSEVGLFEGKMFSSHPDRPLASLLKNLSLKNLEEYLIKRDEFYLLIGFSFLTDETKLDAWAKDYWLDSERGKIRTAQGERTAHIGDDLLEKIIDQQPVPIKRSYLDLSGTWMLHVCIIDRNIFERDETGELDILRIKQTPFAKKIMKTIEEHQLLYLTSVLETLSARRASVVKKAKNDLTDADRTFLRHFEEIQLNICTNFNILRIHSMAQRIGNLEHIIVEYKAELHEYKAELLEKDAKLLESDAKLLDSEARWLESEARRLESEAELLDFKNQPQLAKEKRQQSAKLRIEIKKMRAKPNLA